MNQKLILAFIPLLLILGCTGVKDEGADIEEVTEDSIAVVTQVSSEADARLIGESSVEEIQDLQNDLMEITAMMADLY